MWIHLAVSSLFLPDLLSLFFLSSKDSRLEKDNCSISKVLNSLKKMICNTGTLCLNLTLSYKRVEMTSRFFLCFELKDWNKRCQLKCLRFTNLRRWTEKSHYFPRNILLISFLFKFQFTYFMNTRYTKKKKEVEIILACM